MRNKGPIQWEAPASFEPVGTAIESAIGTGSTTIDDGDVGAEADALLVQAIDQDVRFRMDGNAPSANSFIVTADYPPMVLPFIAGTSVYRFAGAAVGAILVVQPIKWVQS